MTPRHQASDGLENKPYNLQVCQEQGVPVQLQAPQMCDIDIWRGAFISSTSRLLLPVCEVQYEKEGQPCKKVRSPTAV
jgi:branched-subunit amino acid aminotransferase/4-amino-4-deoxychorismate lyase